MLLLTGVHSALQWLRALAGLGAIAVVSGAVCINPKSPPEAPSSRSRPTITITTAPSSPHTLCDLRSGTSRPVAQLALNTASRKVDPAVTLPPIWHKIDIAIVDIVSSPTRTTHPACDRPRFREGEHIYPDLWRPITHPSRAKHHASGPTSLLFMLTRLL
jgi:hypothetical protein